MPYIDKDAAGNIVGIYAMQQREGQAFVETAELYVPPPTAVELIRAIEAPHEDDEKRAIRQHAMATAVQLYLLLTHTTDKAAADVALRASDKGYALMASLEDQIIPLRKLVV